VKKEIVCAGVPASWINGWLAGVGATVLDSRIRLHWSEDTNRAVLTALDVDPLESLAASWPSQELIADLPIARDWEDAGKLDRNVTTEVFAQRACAARNHPQSWALSSTMTDLCVDKSNAVRAAKFNPPAPRGFTLHDRVTAAHRLVEDPSRARILASLMGEAAREKVNGLGFDQSRLGSLADNSNPWTDPVVELLAFFGLAIFPMRGSDQRLGKLSSGDARQKGWQKSSDGGTSRSFHWPAWSQPLDVDGIDALMDVWDSRKRSQWPLVGVHAAWRTLEFESRTDKDVTRAFGSERL